MSHNPYHILGVSKDATQAEIKKAYRKLAKALHPDLSPGDKRKAAEFQKVGAAYDILGDPEKRRRFDAGEIDASGQEKPERQYYRQYAGADPEQRYHSTSGFDDFGDVSDRARHYAGYTDNPADKGRDRAVAATDRSEGGRARQRKERRSKMTVRSLMKDKGTTVSTTSPKTTVQEIMDLLEIDEVSAVVVTDEDHAILGIVSGGDILRALNQRGPATLATPVTEVMTTEVLTCNASEPLSKVYELMDANRIRHVPVVEDGQLKGIINTLDVVKHRLREIASEAEALKDYVAGRG